MIYGMDYDSYDGPCNVVKYHLERYDMRSDEFSDHTLYVSFNAYPVEYEDDYLFYAGDIEITGISCDDKKFQVTEQEYNDILDYLFKNVKLKVKHYYGDR